MSAVVIRVEGAPAPVRIETWPAERAEARAEQLREEVRRAGWCHKIEVRSS